MPENKHSKICIDINCDLGEGDSLLDCDKDALLMPFISSCNIACGGHAGNIDTIRQLLRNAKQHQLKIGAHPGYADKHNFGRKHLTITFSELKASLQQQLKRLLKIAQHENACVHHIKLHGALYNDVEKQPQLASKLAVFFKQEYPQLKILGLAGGKLAKACREQGIEFIDEGFMDRRYLSDGTLAPRNQPDAIIKNRQQSIKQAIALARKQPLISSDGKKIIPEVSSICLHGDNPEALDIARQLNERLKLSGICLA